MVPFVLTIIALVGALIHILLSKQPRSAAMVFDTLLKWLFFFAIGVWGLLGAYSHLLRSDEIAEAIGWTTGSPFQLEIGFANMAFGICGILATWCGMGFRWATATNLSVFLWGAAYVHISDTARTGNLAPYNTGFLLFADIILPIFLLGLLFALSRAQKRTAA